VAANKAVTTSEDTSVTVTLTATDVDGNALTYAVVASPSHGALSGTGSNRTYTPSANYNGSDTFTYKANDGTADSNTATVTITITSVNDAPVAADKAVTTNKDTSAPITLTATDADGNPLTYAVVANPAHGTLSGTGSNRTYAPTAGYSGSDSFTYKANDGTADSNVATVSITVGAAANTAPVAANDSYNVNTGAVLSVPAPGVLGNDTDAQNNTLTAAKVIDPGHGTVTLNANGSLTYTPTANYSGPDSFTYKANDGTADSNVATVNITVNTPTNTGEVSVMPADGAVDVYDETVVTATLTGAGDIKQIFNAQTFSLKVTGPAPGTTSLASPDGEDKCVVDGFVMGEITYNESNTSGTFTQAEDCELEKGTVYTATIASAAGGLSEPMTWQFTTIADSPDTDDDGVPDNEDDHPGNKGKGTPPSSRGKGKFLIDVTDTAGASLAFTEGIAETSASLNQAGKPSGYEFPDGLVRYQVVDLVPGRTATVKVTFPSGIPAGSKVFKVGSAGFKEVGNPAIQGNTVTLTLTDGGAGDSDGVANGVIVDPVGVAIPVASGSGSLDLSNSSSGGGCAVAPGKTSGGAGAMAPLLLLLVGAVVRRLRKPGRRG
jgi:hypothetical protein